MAKALRHGRHVAKMRRPCRMESGRRWPCENPCLMIRGSLRC
jgi:hypothetical protein